MSLSGSLNVSGYHEFRSCRYLSKRLPLLRNYIMRAASNAERFDQPARKYVLKRLRRRQNKFLPRNTYRHLKAKGAIVERVGTNEQLGTPEKAKLRSLVNELGQSLEQATQKHINEVKDLKEALIRVKQEHQQNIVQINEYFRKELSKARFQQYFEGSQDAWSNAE